MARPAARPETDRPLRVLELYSGIGGCSAALPPAASVVAALEINQTALDVYRRNFLHTALPVNLEFITVARLQRWKADLWWLSPPCQPFTVRGLQRDSEDPRARSFLRLIDCLRQAAPAYLALENVPGFRGSQTHARLRSVLDELGYAVREWVLCPTQLGIPNRRQRLYLVAGLSGLRPMVEQARDPRRLADYLDAEPSPALWVDRGSIGKYRQAVSLLDSRDAAAVASCFTSAYGRSLVRSGSYLDTPTGPRRFSPMEILRLLGFPPQFSLPPTLSNEVAWRLVGNSLSVPAVRSVLSTIPELAGACSTYSR